MLVRLNINSNYNNSYKKRPYDNNQVIRPYNLMATDTVSFKGVKDLAADSWQKLKDKGSDVVSAVQQLFNKEKDKLTPAEVDFITAYTTKEQEIEAKYEKKIAEIKDSTWEFFTHSGEKQRQKLRDEMKARLRGVDDMREAFEAEEKEFIEFRKYYRLLAENLNLSKEVIAAIMKDEEANIKRQAINDRKKRFAQDYGLNKIAGYQSELASLQKLFIDKVDDEKAGKFLNAPITNAMLFYGPTGCGKTTFAKALAEETDCNFVEIKTRGLTQNSKEKAFKREYQDIADAAEEKFQDSNIRTIALIDEADRFFNEKTSQEFINYMKDVMETCSTTEHITLFLTTNDPLKIPYELRAPSRIGLIVSLDPPDKENTIQVLKHYFRGIDTQNIDFERVYTKLEEIKPDVYSNTHLKSISDLAFEISQNEDEDLNTDLIIRAIDKYNKSSDNPELTRIPKSYIDKYLEEQKQIGSTQCLL